VNFFNDETTHVDVQILVLKEAVKAKQNAKKKRAAIKTLKKGSTLERMASEEDRADVINEGIAQPSNTIRQQLANSVPSDDGSTEVLPSASSLSTSVQAPTMSTSEQAPTTSPQAVPSSFTQVLSTPATPLSGIGGTPKKYVQFGYFLCT